MSTVVASAPSCASSGIDPTCLVTDVGLVDCCMPAARMDTTAAFTPGVKGNADELREDPVSIPNSQASSLNDASSVNTSQTSVSCNHNEPKTHSGSTFVLANGSNGPENEATSPSRIHNNPSALVMSTTSHPSQIPQGQKRMSNGHLKAPSIDSPTSPSEASFRTSHARRLSNVSSGSQGGELAAQLRTRLSYAMVKVQHGWQDRTIDEVESLASHQSSMAPPTPVLRHSQGSPVSEGPHVKKTEIPEVSGRSSRQLSSDDSNSLRHHARSSPTNHHSTTHGHALLYPDPQPPRSTQHQQNGSRDGSAPRGKHTINRVPRLAPAFDAASPRDACRVAQPNPPRLNTNGGSNLSNHSLSSTLSSNPPSTPPPRHVSLAKSPSCTTPMEQDAIETLLTMSSPGNSQHGPMYGHLPGSPLRNHFRPPERHVGFASSQPSRAYAKPPSHQAAKANFRTDEEVDRYLDQMPKDDDSDDD